MKLIVVGRLGDISAPNRGLMARLVCNKAREEGIPVFRTDGAPFDADIHRFVEGNESQTVVVHFTKTHLTGTIAECNRYNLPLIQAASGQKLPEDVPIPVIDAPNLALGVLVLFDIFPRLGQLLKQLEAKSFVAEGHQQGKTSPAITAQTLADFVGVPHSEIGHLRSDAFATAFLGIPPEFHGGYAVHRVTSIVKGMKIGVDMEIHGRDVYWEGLKVLCNQMIQDYGHIGHRVHNLTQYLFDGI